MRLTTASRCVEVAGRRLRRSQAVAAPLLASAALAILAGCKSPQPKRCVDENNHVVDQSFCASQPNPGNPNDRPGYWPYHFYYGGYGGFAPGTIVSGGSNAPSPGVSYSTTTTRGGFGSSFGGGDGAGGHGGGGGE